MDQWELDSLIEAAGLARLREYVITVGLCRDIESAYRDKLRTVDPEWAEREGIHSIEDYRKGFYEPYSPKGIMFNLLFENRTPGDPVVVAEILKRVRTRQTESPKSA